MKVKELHLESGWWVRCRPFPPMAIQGIMDKPEYWYPPPPQIDVKTKSGSEKVSAPFESPEYQEWWRKREEVDAARRVAWQQAGYKHGVVEWSEDNETYTDEVPKSWKLSPVIEEQLGKQEDRRLAFILYELMATNDDLNNVRLVVFPSSLSPVEEGELQAAEDSFSDPMEG